VAAIFRLNMGDFHRQGINTIRIWDKQATWPIALPIGLVAIFARKVN
jgi:hypothetical protein